jgi:prepilin-type N-terminal cleavage/methylation domain-containing protein
MGDPQSLHKYAYCHGDPVMGIDPSGNMTLVEMMVSTAVVGIMAAFTGQAVVEAWTGDAVVGWRAFAAILKTVATIEIIAMQRANPKAIKAAVLSGLIAFAVRFISGIIADVYNKQDFKKVLIYSLDAFASSALISSVTFGLLDDNKGKLKKLWHASKYNIGKLLTKGLATAGIVSVINLFDELTDEAIGDKGGFEWTPVMFSFITVLLAFHAEERNAYGALSLAWSTSTIIEHGPGVWDESKKLF